MQYFRATETAKLMRAVLKEAFPAIKFSVRTEDTNSVNVSWTDGPTEAMVKDLLDRFKGGGFDGMTDSSYSIHGRWDGETVHFGTRFLFYRREYSDAMVERALACLVTKYAANFRDAGVVPNAASWRKGDYWNVELIPGSTWNNSLQGIINQALHRRSAVTEVLPSATAVRAGEIVCPSCFANAEKLICGQCRSCFDATPEEV